jgi:hypothetical protein
VQRALVVAQFELAGQSGRDAVGRDLVMLKFLGRRDECGVAQIISLNELDIFSVSTTSASMAWSVCTKALEP